MNEYADSAGYGDPLNGPNGQLREERQHDPRSAGGRQPGRADNVDAVPGVDWAFTDSPARMTHLRQLSRVE
jgi:hypothetical protein